MPHVDDIRRALARYEPERIPGPDLRRAAVAMVLRGAEDAAPEVLRGKPAPQSDLYALGFVMIEMLNGRPPYLGGSLVATSSLQSPVLEAS